MDQPPNPSPLSPITPLPSTTITTNSKEKEKEKEKKDNEAPSPEEILTYYESEGLETREASLRAISDLQSLFFRAVAKGRNSNSKNNKDRRKLNNINATLSLLEMKVDTKPGFSQSFAIGLASASVLSLTSHLANIWKSVNSATNSNA